MVSGVKKDINALVYKDVFMAFKDLTVKITELILFGYKRLMLNNINKLTYTPESIYQIILGTNGSGKSSVLYELSPLPAHSNDYIKNGYKEIKIDHNNSKYILKSIFKSTNKHEFFKDTVNLNPGGTGSVQKELVEQEFGLTQEIHELLIGVTHFTNLSPAKRREWITRLCDVDFTYAIGVYKKIKSAARDSQGALKHVRNRLTNESNKLLAIGDLKDIEDKYQSLHRELTCLFTETDNGSKDTSVLKPLLTSKLKFIEEISIKLGTKVPTMPTGYRFISLDEITNELSALNTSKQIKESLRTRLASEYQDLNELFSCFKEAGEEDIETMKLKYVDLKQERGDVTNKLNEIKELVIDPIEVNKSLLEVMGPLIGILKELPANQNRKFNKDKLSRAKEHLASISRNINAASNKIANYETYLERMLLLKEQECPKCYHRWIPGKSDVEQARVEKEISIENGKKEILNDTEVKVKNYIESAEEYEILFHSYKQLTIQYPKLRDLWDLIISSPDLQDSPTNLIPRIHSFNRDVEYHIRLNDINESIVKLEIMLKAEVGDDKTKGMGEKLDSLTVQLEEIIVDLEKGKKETSVLTKYKNKVKSYLDLVDKFEAEITNLYTLRDEIVRSLRASGIDSVIKSHQNQLSELQAVRTEKNTLESIIEDLSNDEDDISLNHFCLDKVASELSPVDGLIAEQLTGFIGGFVAHINQVIQSIWSYELKVLPCGLESGDLDYKFPIRSTREGTVVTAPDISKGSEAQVEVINLAFRLVTMVYLGLEEAPVYLDEIGRSFDEQHRINVMNFIKRLVDTGNYTQLFMVSHYAAFHGSFVQSEVMVLDGANISVPVTHNKHVKME